MTSPSSPTTNQFPSYLPFPPIHEKLIDNNGYLTITWQNWFNAINQVMGFAITHDYIVPKDSMGNQNSPVQDAVLSAVPAYTTEQRNTFLNATIDNKRFGSMIYNLTTNKINVNEGGTWVYYTSNPA